MKKFLILFMLISFYIIKFLYPASYSSSAHGNYNYGVKRQTTLSFHTGNCKHCHDMHGSSPNGYALFYPAFVNQTDNFCMQCHDYTTIVSKKLICNQNYSYRAGGYVTNTTSSIKEQFDTNIQTSVHDLDKILTFIQSKSWNFNTNSSPCVACHNPHYAQGDPYISPLSAKSPSTRGWLLARPSKHGSINDSDKLWGDESSERMNVYAGAYTYQAPYRYNSSTTYEPDGSSTTNGSNLTDFATFCQDCHQFSMQNAPYNLANTPIDWSTSGDKHGLASADGNVYIKPPYSTSLTGNYVLSCVDCHEPHGARNAKLIREEVNGDLLSSNFSSISNKNLAILCIRCHKDDYDVGDGSGLHNYWEYIHHEAPDAPYTGFCWNRCGSCHGGQPYNNPISCDKCHLHGKDDSWLLNVNSGCYTGRRCF